MKTITIYTTADCAYCPMVKKLYDTYGINYQVVQLDEKPELRQAIIDKTGLITVPVTTDGFDYIAGYNVQKLLELARA